MRILHVISDENIGGAGVLLCTLLEGLDRTRFESEVALPRGSALTERIEAMGVRVHPLRYSCDRPSLASVREISHLVRTQNFDVVHANAAVSARIAGRRCGVRVVHTRHCCFPPSRSQRLFGRFNRALSDCVIATADAAAENLREMGIPPKKIETVINGSTPVREVDADTLAEMRLKYGISEGDFTVGIVARLEACKGHETFLRAAQVLSQRDGRYRFLIVGTGTRRALLEKLAESLGIRSKVVFTGFVADMAPIYRILRVNVNCSSGTETSCLALSEGMSAGVPAIVSDYGGNRAMVEGSDGGIIYPVGDFEALADAIARIASDPDREARMRDAAYARYLERYTPKGMIDRVAGIYEKLAQKQRSP